MSEPNASAIPASRAASRSRTHKLTVTAMLSAVAFLLMFIEFPIPALIPAFVKLDVSDLPELLAAFSLGPVYGVAVALLKNLLFLVLHGTSSAYVGEVFNFIMGGVFAFAAGACAEITCAGVFWASERCRKKQFDYCLLDAPAGLGEGFRLAVCAADRCLEPPCCKCPTS